MLDAEDRAGSLTDKHVLYGRATLQVSPASFLGHLILSQGTFV